jgi:hypothetical protein
VQLVAWLRKHRLDLALAGPLFLYVLVLTVSPIVDTARLSLTGPPDEGFPSLVNYRTVL